MKRTTADTVLYVLAVIFFILSLIMLYKGYDKMMHYENSDYSWRESVNAYVGGDAYNYIINGNYATGFFTLAVGFLIISALDFGLGLILSVFANNGQDVHDTVKELQIKEIQGNITDIKKELIAFRLVFKDSIKKSNNQRDELPVLDSLSRTNNQHKHTDLPPL